MAAALGEDRLHNFLDKEVLCDRRIPKFPKVLFGKCESMEIPLFGGVISISVTGWFCWELFWLKSWSLHTRYEGSLKFSTELVSAEAIGQI